jgi:hypothetical protein
VWVCLCECFLSLPCSCVIVCPWVSVPAPPCVFFSCIFVISRVFVFRREGKREEGRGERGKRDEG